ncbi:MAG: prephenate dehydrogenase [Candidatus Scalindua rubra]|uniref:Cyclohexadienyl dehydrogenase/5-enolpyruvylshikmate 3-P synthase n=1 Tax=Candidatus Scalindua brodae TaxID=237368 RepID=A0A0B0EJF4_9BACT|nr:MAG: cyclohexadienyl dehydrogenase/5-enolpyruvylshikmate 3-P synthase [Candidatus Scalindua brodae]MBZ0108368.1 prephenate dehydrogenase [Candidatus Scalindua rubra]TWU34066.1 prephenate dehydrogenase [Candidatus Brocadiaceae bacterium S225]
MNFGVVAIVGTGLIGGSIGLCLKERGLATAIIGVGHRKVSINKALKIKAIDEGTTNIEKAAKQADIIILATSVNLIPDYAKKIIPLMKKSAILTDVGSTKDYIVSQVNNEIKSTCNGEKPNFIGAHPLAGSEKRGIESARPNLFEGSVCVLTPTNFNSKKCITRLSNMWKALGARISIMTPSKHDEILALVSHLPHFVASSLAGVIDEKHWKFAAGGLRDTTRIASGDPELWLSISRQNKQKIIEALRCFSKEVECTINDLEQGNDKKLLGRLKKAKTVRDKKKWKQE